MAPAFTITTVPTKPISGQKTGTSGLRKKVTVFQQENYLANWVQSLFSSLPELPGSILALGGDGRYWNREAIDIICRLAAGNGVGKVLVGQDGILCTPAMSAVIRRRKLKGGLILTASHNPGGKNEDWGIKYNGENGGPASEAVTGKIWEGTKSIKEYVWAVEEGDGGESPFKSVDYGKVGKYEFQVKGVDRMFVVEVIDNAEDYVEVLKGMFDFEKLKRLFKDERFSFLFDAMSGVTGPYARKIFMDILGGKESCVMRGKPLEDFGGAHPDPNLTYAAELVKACDPKKSDSAPQMGAASDGDGDRNMILGRGFFVTPSDSVAVIAAKCKEAIPYFSSGLAGVARSMPTAGAIDRVAEKMGIGMYETPTGWKYFGNLMDAGKVQICGEESFGTGSDHVREKDGIFAVLCWLSILAHANDGNTGDFIGIEDIVKDFWKTYGRNYFSRYDYEEVDSDAARRMMDHIANLQKKMNESSKGGESMKLDDKLGVGVKIADDFEYKDPIDGSVAKGQGKRFVFEDGSRIVFRLSGTGSSGATVRLYVEKYEGDETKQSVDAQEALKPFIDCALRVSKLKEFTGRDKPTVIT